MPKCKVCCSDVKKSCAEQTLWLIPWANEEVLKDCDQDVFQQLRFGVPLPTNGQLLFALVAEKLGQRSEKHLRLVYTTAIIALS
jgi:hypothetical protein